MLWWTEGRGPPVEDDQAVVRFPNHWPPDPSVGVARVIDLAGPPLPRPHVALVPVDVPQADALQVGLVHEVAEQAERFAGVR